MTPSLEGLITAQPCPICHERAAKPGICDECGGAVPVGRFGEFLAYQSQSIDHRHQKRGGDPAKAAHGIARKKLCLDCYRKDFHAVYPNEPIPV